MKLLCVLAAVSFIAAFWASLAWHAAAAIVRKIGGR